MATIGSDGVSLWVGDGGTTEVFTVLKGLAVSQLEINQRSYVANAIASDAWQVQVGTANRQVGLDCESYATDEAAALRLKTLAMLGTAGNFRLELRGAEAMQMSARVIQYREESAAGEIKRLRFRLESSGQPLLV